MQIFHNSIPYSLIPFFLIKIHNFKLFNCSFNFFYFFLFTPIMPNSIIKIHTYFSPKPLNFSFKIFYFSKNFIFNNFIIHLIPPFYSFPIQDFNNFIRHRLTFSIFQYNHTFLFPQFQMFTQKSLPLQSS